MAQGLQLRERRKSFVSDLFFARLSQLFPSERSFFRYFFWKQTTSSDGLFSKKISGKIRLGQQPGEIDEDLEQVGLETACSVLGVAQYVTFCRTLVCPCVSGLKHADCTHSDRRGSFCMHACERSAGYAAPVDLPYRTLFGEPFNWLRTFLLLCLDPLFSLSRVLCLRDW